MQTLDQQQQLSADATNDYGDEDQGDGNENDDDGRGDDVTTAARGGLASFGGSGDGGGGRGFTAVSEATARPPMHCRAHTGP